ncbi:MAG: hypothetical protein Q7K42_05640 [Candidatus Diapherotrites archaeon]|nr:hypothetical protein [Candidatus Diapherotrites archaeon]
MSDEVSAVQQSIQTAQAQAPPVEKKGFFSQERIEKYIYIAKFSALAVLFGLLEILYQFYFLTEQNLQFSLVRGFALSGATLLCFALIIGPLVRLQPKLNFIAHRRMVGIWGFLFIFMHFNTVVNFYFLGNPAGIFLVLDPFQNPLIWGLLAYFIYLLLFLTSNDLLQYRILKYKNWQNLHRLGYLAFIFSVIHYLVINPSILNNFAAYLLLLATLIAIVLQIAVFFKTIKKKNFKTLATIVGLILILFGLALFYLAIVPAYFH